MTKLEIIPLEGIPEITPGDDLVEIVGQIDTIQSGDILVVTQMIISKAYQKLVNDLEEIGLDRISGGSIIFLQGRGGGEVGCN